MSENLMSMLVLAGIAFIALLVVGMIFARLYKRSSKEISFVRTGFGGQKVIMNGGAIVLPVLHEAIPVNMNTLRLEVSRKEQQALITKDRMRVDVLAEFYLRVKPEHDAIANAAQTLGGRTLNPEALKDMIEGKFVDALRSVAALMEMDELHEQRSQFVQQVQEAVSEDLLKNGLELESVSLTGLDQTPKQFFNPDNVFDAEGLAKMTAKIESRKKEINDVEQETSVLIEQKNMDSERQRLEIQRENRYAQLEQRREIEIREAEQSASIATRKADQEKEARNAEIMAEREVQEARIAADRIMKTAEIEKQKDIQAREIELEKVLKEQEIERQKVLELAEQGREIAVAEKSKAKSLADEQAYNALSEAVRAEEGVETAREVEKAQRDKQIEIIEAQKEAEKQATAVRVAAAANKEAAADDAEAVTIAAEAQATAVRIKAQADEERFRIEAEGSRLMNEAMNQLSDAQVALKKVMSLHENLPHIIGASVKPLENIDGMKIISINGLNGARSTNSTEESSAKKSLPEALVDSALQHRVAAPLIDSLLKEAGISGDLKDLQVLEN
jgi:uncharacterized membrane protein YqiK